MNYRRSGAIGGPAQLTCHKKCPPFEDNRAQSGIIILAQGPKFELNERFYVTN